MTGIKKALRFLSVDESEKQIIANQITYENIRRIFFLAAVAVPISLAHVLLFGAALKASTGTEHTWRLGIFLSHLIISGTHTLIGLLIYFFSIRTKKNSRVARISLHVVIVMLLFGGSIITAIDQLVTSAINPYIVTCLVSAIVILVRPLHAILYYLVSYIAFYYLVALTQHSPDILISNRVNGITVTGLGLCLSFIFWRMNMVRIKQELLIEQQRSELIKNIEELQYYSDELKASNATKDKLFSVVAHDLRTPFNSILGLTKLLAEDSEAMNPAELKQLMQILHRDSSLSYELLNNLLDWSRTQLKKISPQPTRVNLRQAVSEIRYEIEYLSGSKEIKLINDYPENLNVFVDPPMFHSILRNLITNAIKFTPSGGKITIGASTKDNLAEICISDTGVGIPHEKLEKLFSSDSLQTTRGTESEKGTGLGLQICKEFIELNGGKIRVVSEVGKGSSFYVTLPLAK